MLADLLPFLVMGVVVLVVSSALLRVPPSAGKKEAEPELPADPAVDRTPLPGFLRQNYLANLSPRTLVPRGPDVLELRFGTGVKIGGAISLAVAVCFGAQLFALLEDGFDVLPFVLLHGLGSIALFLSGLYLLLDLGRTTFDRAAGQWTVHHPFAEAVSRPLDHILALQLISGGVQKGDNGERETFQVNFILHGSEPRENVAEHHDGNHIQLLAKKLADFLQVPLVDLTLPLLALPEA